MKQKSGRESSTQRDANSLGAQTCPTWDPLLCPLERKAPQPLAATTVPPRNAPRLVQPEAPNKSSQKTQRSRLTNKTAYTHLLEGLDGKLRSQTQPIFVTLSLDKLRKLVVRLQPAQQPTEIVVAVRVAHPLYITRLP